MSAAPLATKPLLITSSILDSYAWYKEAPGSWKEKAESDLINALTRVYTPLDAAVKRGMAFEERVCRDLYLARDVFHKRHGDMLMPFFDECVGGRQQDVVKSTITIDGQDYVLYGKADILFPKSKNTEGRIIDIKTTSSWKGMAKYTSRSQHLLYITASRITNFKYLVAVGEDTETHEAPDTPPITKWIVDSVIPIDASMPVDEASERLEERVRMFVAFLRTRPELLRAYTTIFTK